MFALVREMMWNVHPRRSLIDDSSPISHLMFSGMLLDPSEKPLQKLFLPKPIREF